MFPDSLCFRQRDKVSFRGNPFIEDNEVMLLSMLACDSSKRATCKSKPEIGRFLKRSSFFFVFQHNIVIPDRFEMGSEDKSYY